MSVPETITRTRTAASLSSATHSSAVFGVPVIFGAAAHPLAGRLHTPRGIPAGCVVLCNPWGYEENCSFASFQRLACLLAQSGFETLRFDYESCGNSWGNPTDPDRLSAWTDNCRQAIEYMRARCGVGVHIVGLRLGATLAALASAQTAIESAVLWDPVVKGKSYLRALRAMSMMGVGAAPDPSDPNSLVTIGHTLTSSTVAALNGVQLQSLSEARLGATLLISRPNAPEPKRLLATLQSLRVPCSLEEHPGTDTMLDCAAEQSVIPNNIIERIVAWLKDRPAAVIEAPPVPPGPAVLVAPAPNDWIEEHLSIGEVGLSGVLTLPRSRTRNGVVVMANNGVARSIGPARAWVEWARLWAAEGIASLRVDLAGLGNSPRHPQQREGDQYPIQAIDDLRAAIDAMRHRGLVPAAAVGLCSGAFLSLDAAAAGVGLSAVAAINGQLFHLPDPAGSPERRRRAAPTTHPWVQQFFNETRVGRKLAQLLPYPFWWVLDRLRLQPSPMRGVEAAAAHSRMLLIYGAENPGWIRMRQRARTSAYRWRAREQLVVMEGLDHSMFAPRIRTSVEERVRRFLLESLPLRPNSH